MVDLVVLEEVFHNFAGKIFGVIAKDYERAAMLSNIRSSKSSSDGMRFRVGQLEPVTIFCEKI